MVTAVSYFPYTITPAANIGPATYADGTTLMAELEQLRQWLNTVLVDQVNDNYFDLLAQFQAGVANAEQAYQDFLNNTTTELAALNDTSVANLTNTPTSATAQAITALVQNLAVLPAQLDALVAAKVTDGTAGVREALDGIYAHATALADLIPATQRGAADGVATLDNAGKVPSTQLPAPSLAGTYTARPAANTVPTGTLYLATDVQETYRSAGAYWQSVGTGGTELAYAEISADFHTTATTTAKADVTGLSVTFVAGERPIIIRFGGVLVTNDSTKGAYIGLVLDGATKAEAGGLPAAGFQSYERSRRLPALTPGSVHTFKATLGGTAGTDVSVLGADTNPAWIQVVNA